MFRTHINHRLGQIFQKPPLAWPKTEVLKLEVAIKIKLSDFNIFLEMFKIRFPATFLRNIFVYLQ